MRTIEDQIDEIKERAEDLSLVNCYPDFSEIQDWLIEAERRAEQRVRAEIARDSERLDWISRTPDFFFELLQDQPGDGDIMVITGDMVFTGSTFRDAIDAAREVE